MRISVNASKRDDILRERDVYNREREKQNAIHDQQESRYDFASDYNLARIEDIVRSQIPGLSEMGVRVSIDEYFSGGVRIEFNADNRDIPNRSLRWSWNVAINRQGEIVKDSSSWSNIDVTTPEEVEDLRKSVDILSKLVSIDWKPILESAVKGRPKYSDYVSVKEMKNRDNEFNESLKLAAIEELIGSPVWIKGQSYQQNRWSSGDNWYMINSQTEKFFNISSISDYNVKRLKAGIENNEYGQDKLEEQLKWNKDNYTERVKKEKLLPCIYENVETMDMQGNVTIQNAYEDADVDADASTKISSSGLVTI